MHSRKKIVTFVENDGLYFVRHRRFRTAVLVYHDPGTGRSVPLYTFPDWPPDQRLAVGPDGGTFAYTHAERRAPQTQSR